MIKVADYQFDVESKIEFDNYVPAKITFQRNKNLANMFYWRIGSIKKSLIEFKLDRLAGRIYQITLVTFEEAKLVNSTFVFDCDRFLEDKIPTFLIDIDKVSPFDDSCNFKVLLYNNVLQITMDDLSQVKEWVVSNRIIFGIDSEKRMISISINNLDQNEYQVIKESLKL